MTVQIIDSHAHLLKHYYPEDLEEVIARALEQNVVQFVDAGIDLNAWDERLELIERYPQIFLGVGLHPHEAKFWNSDLERRFREISQHPRVVGIGECGLDYYYDHSDRELQLTAFKAQVSLAKEVGKPLIIHSRDAWDHTFEVLETVGEDKVRGVFHCFTGGPEVMPAIERLGFYVSFSGILTFANAKPIQAAAQLVSDDRILVETDCPYLAPMPYRGKRNEPAYVWKTAEKLAELRQTNLANIAQLTTENTRRLFDLPD